MGKEISAGGLVYRQSNGILEVQLIQDRYGKITLPKGKMEPGETVEQTALREIKEETGIEGRIVRFIAQIGYQFALPDTVTIDKEVHYFLVEATGGEQQVQIEEIRGVEWLSPQEAWKQQKQSGYHNNDDVVRSGLHMLGYEVNEA